MAHQARDAKTGMASEYTKPDVADYGDLEELTARTSGGFNDLPLGAANVAPDGMSTP